MPLAADERDAARHHDGRHRTVQLDARSPLCALLFGYFADDVAYYD